MADEPAEAGSLYDLPLAEFTPARNALAARLRKEGDRAGSEAVKRLVKPSLTAWALNQVARRQPEVVAGLIDAGRQLASAQQALLAGAGQAAFRDASRAEKEAVAAVVQAAAGWLAEGDRRPGKPLLDRLEATARAAASSAEGAALLEAGRLTADLDPTGFGELAGFGLPAAPIPFPRQPARAPDAREEAAPAAPDARLSEAREDVARRQRELLALRQEAGEAEGEAARARQAASTADRASAEARKTAEQAEKVASQARRAAHDAAEGLAAVRARLDAAADELERAEAELRELRGGPS